MHTSTLSRWSSIIKTQSIMKEHILNMNQMIKNQSMIKQQLLNTTQIIKTQSIMKEPILNTTQIIKSRICIQIGLWNGRRKNKMIAQWLLNEYYCCDFRLWVGARGTKCWAQWLLIARLIATSRSKKERSKMNFSRLKRDRSKTIRGCFELSFCEVYQTMKEIL